MSRMNTHAIAQILSAASRLRFLHISFNNDSWVRGTRLNGMTTTSDVLENLSIEADNPFGNVQYFLVALTFPNIHSLQLLGCRQPPDLHPFLENDNGATLEHLSIVGLGSVGPDYIQVPSQYTSNVWSLEITDDALLIVFDALTPSDDGITALSVLFANLQVLII